MSPLKVLELYCGIGGCATALAGSEAQIVRAFDLSGPALRVYRHNHGHPTDPRSLGSLPTDALRRWGAALWWMSPPCQPFTRRGAKKDAADPRAESFLALLDQIQAIRPRHLALENVPGFNGSECHRRLLETLDGAGYRPRELDLCPSELGWPNRRRRYYLIASLDRLAEPPPLRETARRPLSTFLDPTPEPGLSLDPEIARRYRRALHRVDAADPRAVTACFTAAYGRSIVRSGSYLETAEGLRRFSPPEVLRLLGFPASFRLPGDLSRAKAWSLAGNSLSLPAVRRALAHLAPLRHLEAGPPPSPASSSDADRLTDALHLVAPSR